MDGSFVLFFLCLHYMHVDKIKEKVYIDIPIIAVFLSIKDMSRMKGKSLFIVKNRCLIYKSSKTNTVIKIYIFFCLFMKNFILNMFYVRYITSSRFFRVPIQTTKMNTHEQRRKKHCSFFFSSLFILTDFM